MRPRIRYLSGLAATTVVVCVAVTPASSYVENCAGPAATGCFGSPSHSDHSFIETRSMKDGAAADSICAVLISGSTLEGGGCLPNTTFVRRCYYGGVLVHGFHSGSSNAWIVDGRDATASDASVC